MNPFDELSVEESVRIRERGGVPVDDILAFTAGPAKAADVLRTAMAMGADRSIHVEVDPEKDGGELEPLGVAKLLKAVVEKEKNNLVILGKQSIDDDAGQTGQMLAGLLGWPQATQASEVKFSGEGGEVTVTREVDGGVETLRAKLPMIITTDLRLNEPRYASLPNIMKAKKKKLEKKTLADYGVDAGRRLKTIKVTGRGVFFSSSPYQHHTFSSFEPQREKKNSIKINNNDGKPHRSPSPSRWRQSRRCGRHDRQAQGPGRSIGNKKKEEKGFIKPLRSGGRCRCRT
jgi:electron transfer flavoprotein beta subunit